MARWTVWYRVSEERVSLPYNVRRFAGDPELSVAEVKLFTHWAVADKVEADSLEEVYRVMQAEQWTPTITQWQQARQPGVTHRSLSVGDVIENDTGQCWQVEENGFSELPLWNARRLLWRFEDFLGESAWRHPAVPGHLWPQLTKASPPGPDALIRPVWKGQGKKQRLESEVVGDVADFEWEDTRPTLLEVAGKLRAMEALFGPEVWDEYLAVSAPAAFHRRDGAVWSHYDGHWPALGRTKVYVVTGGSEGYYLHVDVTVQPGEQRYETWDLLLGKALGATWEECWQSAARIAWVLGA